MNRSIKALLVVVAINGVIGAGLAYAFSPGGAHGCAQGRHAMGSGGHGHSMDSDRMIEHMATKLNLSKEQRDAMFAIVDKARPQTRALRERMTNNRKQLHALMQQGTTKDSELRKLADDQGRAIADMIVLRTKIRTEIRGVLSDAQRQQIEQWHEQHGQASSAKKPGAARHLSNAESMNFPETPTSKVMM
ncbi:MAG: Spy/CpxP family protein refolding chaperone [Sulfuricaulis sp.]